MPMIVAKVEGRLLDDETVDAFDEAAPIRAATKLAIGHDLKADRLLQPHHVANALVLDFGKAHVVDLFRMMIAKRLTQRGWTQQAADMVGAERRAAGTVHELVSRMNG